MKPPASVCRGNSALLWQHEKQQPGRVERSDPSLILPRPSEERERLMTTLLMKGRRVPSLNHCPPSGLTRLSTVLVLFAPAHVVSFLFFPPSPPVLVHPKRLALSRLSGLTLSLCLQKPNYASLKAPEYPASLFSIRLLSEMEPAVT